MTMPPPSLMVRKFLMGGEPWKPDPNFDYDAFRKELYFFYGTLMDPSTIAEVLDLKEPPVLRPAKITGYKCMLWGPYPALIDAPGKDVHGVVYEVQSPKEKRCLQEYETDHYREARCLIKLEGDTKEIGRTFKWNEDFSLLREGSFDLKDWLLEKREQGNSAGIL